MAQEDIQTMRQYYLDLQNDLESYDTFIEELSDRTLISETNRERTYTSSLFTANDSILDKLAAQKSPTMHQIDMQRGVVDGFTHALQTYSHYDL